MLIELALTVLLHSSTASTDSAGSADPTAPQVTVTRTCTDGAKGRTCRTSTRTVTRTGGAVKGASKAAKPPAPTVADLARTASATTTMSVLQLNGTMLAHLHAMGYDAVGERITVPTVVLVEVLRMPPG